MESLSEEKMVRLEAGGCVEAVALAIALDNPVLLYQCVPDIQ